MPLQPTVSTSRRCCFKTEFTEAAGELAKQSAASLEMTPVDTNICKRMRVTKRILGSENSKSEGAVVGVGSGGNDGQSKP